MSLLGRAGAPDLSPIRDDVRAMIPFGTHPAAGLIKLDAMENPYGLPADLARELADRLSHVALNRYPPTDPRVVKTKLARAIDLPDGCSLMLGNGSDELIHIVIQACAAPGVCVVSPWPSFVRYGLITRLNGCTFAPVPLADGFAIDQAATLATIRERRPVVTFVAWPNNPTGNLFDRHVVERIADEASPGLVVIDEAYQPFARDTWLPDLGERTNVLVMRTLSKIGLAGIRLGCLCGRTEWLAELEKVKPPYNVNALTLETADLMLDHLDVFAHQAARISDERDRLIESLFSIGGVTPFVSAANFVLIRVAEPDEVFAGLRNLGVLVANVSKLHPQLAGCLRVTVGRPQENAAFLEALAQCLSGRMTES